MHEQILPASAWSLDYKVSVEIGAIPIRLRTSSPGFFKLLEDRYGGFVGEAPTPNYELDVELHSPDPDGHRPDLEVSRNQNVWSIRRGDFQAEWDTQSGRGHVQQSANPYSIDTVLRILHTLVLAGEGGFLVHAASAIRNGRAFLFSGVSGAGKTTISRLAPRDVTVLTDEISYVRRFNGVYWAFGTPFAGELARIGENVAAPIADVFFLGKGPENIREPIGDAQAAATLLRNILFFAEDPALVQTVFQSACEFVRSVPVSRLVFRPDPEVWEMIV
jgi:hypothetical protein